MTMLPHGVSAFADLTGGGVECVKLTENHHRKLLVRLHKDGITTEIRLDPTQVADFAVELQDVIDWLRGDEKPHTRPRPSKPYPGALDEIGRPVKPNRIARWLKHVGWGR